MRDFDELGYEELSSATDVWRCAMWRIKSKRKARHSIRKGTRSSNHITNATKSRNSFTESSNSTTQSSPICFLPQYTRTYYSATRHKISDITPRTSSNEHTTHRNRAQEVRSNRIDTSIIYAHCKSETAAEYPIKVSWSS